MLNIRVRKVLRDLWVHKSRTSLVVVSIAIGVFALSLTVRTRAILSRTILQDYAATNPASIRLVTSPFGMEFVEMLREIPGIREVEGQRRLQTRIKIGEDWRPLILTAVADFADTRVNRIAPAGGTWPPPDHTLLLERSYLRAVGVQLGESVQITSANGQQRAIPVVGLAHDLVATSGKMSDYTVFGYISMDTAAWLGAPAEFNELLIAVDGDTLDVQHVQRVADHVRDRLEEENRTVLTSFLPAPGRPVVYNSTEALLLTLAALGTLSLALSAFLTINAISGMLVRQVSHIGILKAIGASRTDLTAMYLGSVLVIAAVATTIALPVGVVGAWALAQALGTYLNYDVRDFNVPLQLMAIELTAGLVVPLLAALYPVLSGTRVTVQQAISNPGVPQVGGGARLRLARRIGRVPMALRYAMRNMFRRKARLALTLMALSLGGAIMISVLSVYASLFATLDQLADYWRQDVRVTFQQPQRIDQIARVALRVPGVIGLEYQTSKRGARQRPNATLPNKTTAIFALLPDSQFLRPQVVQGRWLAPGDRNAAVVNLHFLEQEPDVAVGDMITLDIEGRTTTWRVVGVVAYEILPVAPPQFEQPNVFVSYGPFAEAMDELGTANEALIVTERHDMEFQRHVRQLLDAQLAHSTLPGVVVTHTELRLQITSIYRTLILLLLVMALLFTVVGGLGLTGAMSLNMLERTKELGVLRAVGASNTKVLQIVLAEGLCTGALSWLLAAALALPLSKMLSNAIGVSLQRWPLIYTFPLLGMLIWLGVVMIVAAIASYVPARSAAQLSVRDVLAYE